MGLFGHNGLLSKTKKEIAKVGSHIVKSTSKGVNNITELVKDVVENPTETIGKVINDVTGVTSSARQQEKANEKLQEMAQDFNAEQAQVEREWQEELSNTARQRAVEDSQKAGINPILAAGGSAGGASSGAGAAATSPGGSTGAGVGSNPISMITDLIRAVNNTAKTEAEIQNIAQDTKLKKQKQDNGGDGGTTLTRNWNWVKNGIKETSARNIQKGKEKGFNIFDKNSAWWN